MERISWFCREVIENYRPRSLMGFSKRLSAALGIGENAAYHCLNVSTEEYCNRWFNRYNEPVVLRELAGWVGLSEEDIEQMYGQLQQLDMIDEILRQVAVGDLSSTEALSAITTIRRGDGDGYNGFSGTGTGVTGRESASVRGDTEVQKGGNGTVADGA